IQLQVVDLLSQYIRDPKNKNNLVPSTLGLSEPVLIEQITAYNKLVVDRVQQVQTGATTDNPVVLNLNSDIEEARLKILKNLDNIRSAFSTTINTLKGQQQKLQSQISAVPEKEKMAREKSRQQEIKQNLYLYLLQKREESNIALASTISTARVVDPAQSFGSQIGPRRFQTYLIALLAGLLIPIVIIYIIDLFNDKVTTRSDIEKATNAPILGEIGHNENQQTLVFSQLSSRSVVAEQLRILRSNLSFLIGEQFNKPTILVTSSFGGEGKSFVSTNIGAAMALSGKKTVILEFDLRKPKIVAGLGLQKGQGLTNYLIGAARMDELPQKVPGVEDLYVVPCGPVPPNPSEILLAPKIAELFRWLREEYDVIIIDTAPVGLVSDALTLSQYADATLYVVRQRYTYKKQLLFINELYTQGKFLKMGLLVNDVISKGTRGYYGYGGGRYGYGYGYGYGVQSGYFDEKNSSWFKRLLKGKSLRK
ncbi:MAG: polysaccharide biosynthesis tyrosine autokinase, partial [Chitinophagaceae bacterium]|nr:polysaccharide biosynthesis tyrosine autokinase [Chitinophagaceae bacterium]